MRAFFFVYIFSLAFISIFSDAFSQETEEADSKKIEFAFPGYVKHLTSALYIHEPPLLNNDFLLHARNEMNVKYGSNFRAGISVRNLFSYNYRPALESLNSIALLQRENLFDLDFKHSDSRGIYWLTSVDRFWMETSAGKWEARIGRQRINWGMNTSWNPNDIFNTYSIADFDYEERPGSDAVRVKYRAAELSSLELALKPDSDLRSQVAAAMYKFNFHKYDFQFFGGIHRKHLVTGMGWAGNIKGAGFKGEASYFHPAIAPKFEPAAFLTSITFDYVFSNGIFASVAGLYNDVPESSSQQGFYDFTISPRMLMPVSYSVLSRIGHSFSPIFSADLTAIYGFEKNLLFIMPSGSFSIQENWELALFMQLYLDEQNELFRNRLTAGFLRTRWSF